MTDAEIEARFDRLAATLRDVVVLLSERIDRAEAVLITMADGKNSLQDTHEEAKRQYPPLYEDGEPSATQPWEDMPTKKGLWMLLKGALWH